MKLRSALLIACLIVVPLVAMVSHKIPTATRAAIRESLWDPMIGSLAVTLGLGAPPPTTPSPRLTIAPPLPADPTGTGEQAFPGDPTTRASTASAPAEIVAPPAAGRLELQPPLALGRSHPESSVAPHRPPPAILRGSDDSLPIGAAAGRESLEARLRALGATSIDWTPSQGGDGLHRCSCRLPAEPTGQLHRVFQAAAVDPVAALENLVGQVTAWSMRSVETAAGPSTPLQR